MNTTASKKHIVVSLPHLTKWLEANFNGWHYTKANQLGVSKTVHATVPQSSATTGKQVHAAIVQCKAQCYAKPQTPFAEYIRIIHNRGMTLQVRPDHMVLTRDCMVLVKGAHGAHAATRCKVNGYACTTEAHDAAECTLVADIQGAQMKIQQNPQTHTMKCCAMTHLIAQKEKKGVCAYTIQSLLELASQKGYKAPCALAANMTLSAAVLVTGFSDAGAKFRDRTARQEAARHYGDSIKSFLTSPLARH